MTAVATVPASFVMRVTVDLDVNVSLSINVAVGLSVDVAVSLSMSVGVSRDVDLRLYLVRSCQESIQLSGAYATRQTS